MHGCTYTIEDGQYVCTSGDRRVVMGTEVAFLFDISCGILLRHGAAEQIKQHLDDVRKVFIEEGFPKLAYDLIVVSGAFDLEEVDKLLNRTAYIDVWYRENIETALELLAA